MNNLKEYLKIIFIIFLFAWISFFPQPIQDKYSLYVRIFFGIFLFVLILDGKCRKHIFNIQDWAMWVFLVCLAGGIVYATDKNIAIKTYFYIVATFLLLFYIGKGIFYYEADRNRIALVISICGYVVALIGVIEFYFGKNIIYERFIDNLYYRMYMGEYPRPMSTQFNPTILGTYLLFCLPFSFYFFEKKALFARLWGIFLSIACISVIILTASRGVFLGFISLLIFYFWKSRRRKILIVFMLSAALFISICSYQKNININRFGFKRMIMGSYDSVISKYRLDRIKMTARILKDYPFFGIGFNHFRIRFDEYCDKKNLNENYIFKIPDNMYLTFLSEAGVIGLIGFLIFIILLLKRGLRRFEGLMNGNKKQMLLIALSILTGFLVNMGAYELFYWNNPYMLFCLTCGFIQGSKL